MKVIHIIPNLKAGGAENVLTNISNALYQKGLNQLIFTLHETENDFNRKNINSNIQVLFDKEKLKEILVQNAEIKIVCWMYPSILWYEKFNIKNTFTHSVYWNIRHSDFGTYDISKKIALFGFGVWSRLKRRNIIYCSEKSKYTHEKYFFYKKNAHIIINRLAKSIPKKIEKIENKDFILFVGRFHKQKGPKQLKYIIEKLLSDFIQLEFIILGSGWDVNYFNSKIRNRIQILSSVKNVFEYYQSSKLLLYTSQFGEGYPNVIAEAMAVGCSIVGYDSGDYQKMTINYDLAKIVFSKEEFIKKSKEILLSSITIKQRNETALEVNKKLDFNITVNEYFRLLS